MLMELRGHLKTTLCELFKKKLSACDTVTDFVVTN